MAFLGGKRRNKREMLAAALRAPTILGSHPSWALAFSGFGPFSPSASRPTGPNVFVIIFQLIPQFFCLWEVFFFFCFFL